MAKTIAVTNQKGGVGKTTTAIQLGAGMTIKGKRVLFIDMDPQCSLTYVMGGTLNEKSILEAMMKTVPVEETVQHLEEGDLIPASVNLSVLDQSLTQPGKEYRLREVIAPLQDLYDYIIIDSPPTLGLLTVTVLTATDGVVIPAQADIFSLQGIGQLYSTIDAVKNYCNRDLTIEGILLTRHSDRLVHSRELREMVEQTAEQIGTKVFRATIRESVVIREAETSRMSVFKYAPKSKQAQDYWAFLEEYLGQTVR